MICVDTLRSANWCFKWSCHLFSDTNNDGELHRFAQRMGLKRRWFQDRLNFPHYDLSERKRRQAIHLGATSVRNRQVARLLRDRANSGNKSIT